MTIELIGHVAGFLIALALVPQVVKSLKTKSTKDISILWNSVFLVGITLMVIYGIANTIWPLIIFSSIEAILSAVLLVLKLKYK